MDRRRFLGLALMAPVGVKVAALMPKTEEFLPMPGLSQWIFDWLKQMELEAQVVSGGYRYHYKYHNICLTAWVDPGIRGREAEGVILER